MQKKQRKTITEKTRDLFKKIENKGTFHAKMGSIKDRNGMDPTEAEDIRKRWQEYTELYKKDLHDPMSYTVHGIPQEWVAFPFSRGSSQTRD